MFDYFSERYFINMESRPDRLLLISDELNKHGIKAKRVDGIADKNPRVGCASSHLSIITRACEQQLGSILILEDDVIFHPCIEVVEPKIVRFLEKNDWDMIFFHMSRLTRLRGLRMRICDRYWISRTNGARGTHCYAVNRRAYPVLIKCIKKYRGSHLDAILMNKVCKIVLTYGISPVLAAQRDGVYSDIANQVTDKAWVHGTEWPTRY